MKSVGGKILVAAIAGVAAALLSWTALAETKPKPDPRPDDDEPVGWPLTKRQQQEFKIEERRTPLPGNTEATTRALKAWPTDGQSTDETLQEGMDSADRIDPEIAPLQRFTPPFRPRRFTYEGDEFALTVARAAELDKIALRLRTSGEVIEILAYAAEAFENAKLSTHDAVKLAFKRGMIVRLYLLDEGVRADQITLRALPATVDGPAQPDAPSERVDIDIADKSN